MHKLLFILALLVSGCPRVERRVDRRIAPKRVVEPYVRVLLGTGGKVRSSGRIYIHSKNKVHRLSPGKIELRGGGLYRGRQKIFDITSPLRVRFEDGTFEYNRRSYRGEVIFTKSLVINRLPMEQYLWAVVASEFGSGEIEAMKAGACAARTYALLHLNSERSYDIRATVADQVYRGKDFETKMSIDAVDKTRGLVIVHQGNPIDARYHSTCGGRTGCGKDIFRLDRPYLRGVSCNYCNISPHYSWSHQYSKEDFNKLVREGVREILGKESGRIKSVRVGKKDRSGRVEEVVVRGSKGQFTIRGEEIRRLLDLKSRYFDIKTRGRTIYIKGGGWGHGVGMCSWGAIGKARKGRTFREILRFYYRGTRLKKLYR